MEVGWRWGGGGGGEGGDGRDHLPKDLFDFDLLY